jgi:tripartite-type tricarboxylate transporter receptor subunit TctC
MASEIVGRLNAEIGSILSLPEVKKRMEDIAVETASSSPAELAATTRADAAKWGRISPCAPVGGAAARNSPRGISSANPLPSLLG